MQGTQDTTRRAMQGSDRSCERSLDGEREGSIISLDLGRRRLCVSELLGLQPNMQLEVPFKHGTTVRLRVNGRIAGRGECLSLGDALGVRVTEVYGDGLLT